MSATEPRREDIPRSAQQVDDYTEQGRDGMHARSGGYVVSVLVNALLLYIAHHVLEWQLGWITPSWSAALWAVDLMLEVSIVANVVFLFVDARWLHNLAGAISCAVAAVATGWVYAIFPFDFGSVAANNLAQWALLALLVGTGVTALVMVTLTTLHLCAAGMKQAHAPR